MAAGACAHFATRIRKAVFSAYFDVGWDVATIHKQLMRCYSRRQVQRLVFEFRQNYSWEAPKAKKRGPKKKLCPLALDAISEMLQDDPTLYLRQLKCCLLEEHNLRVSVSTICRAIHEPISRGGLGLSLHTLERRAMQRSSEERMQWRDRISWGDFDHRSVIIVDETNVGKNMTRRKRGWGLTGQRVRSYENFGRDPNGTVMASCNSQGFVGPACQYISEPMDTDRCIQWVEEKLVPMLGSYLRNERNSVVGMDNVTQHHHPRIRQLIEDAGVMLIFLPRYRYLFFHLYLNLWSEVLR
jgi:transposase